jgi:4'-phosphopantetheinyl transferase
MAASEGDPWAPGPLRPALVTGCLHVWRADLSTVAADALDELLCSDERARAERFVNDHHAELWRHSHGLLRMLLGRYLQQDPRSLRFVTGEHGKPALSADHSPELAFNMSHSGELALYAFSRAGAVGVDIEVARRPIDEVAIAERTLGAAAAAHLQALDPVTRRREFLRAWTRHEAELKCLGVGIGGAAGGAIEKSRLWVSGLELGPDVAGAVAAEQPVGELSCWDWQLRPAGGERLS